MCHDYIFGTFNFNLRPSSILHICRFVQLSQSYPFWVITPTPTFFFLIQDLTEDPTLYLVILSLWFPFNPEQTLRLFSVWWVKMFVLNIFTFTVRISNLFSELFPWNPAKVKESMVFHWLSPCQKRSLSSWGLLGPAVVAGHGTPPSGCPTVFNWGFS